VKPDAAACSFLEPDCGELAVIPLMEVTIMFDFALQPIVALIAGILILVVPRLLNYIVAIYLIVIGILGLTGASL
jgi:Protein of unknown function (DUF3096)